MNTVGILTQFLTDGNVPELKKGKRTAQDEPVVYEGEIEKLPSKVREKYHELMNLVDKLQQMQQRKLL